MQNLSRLASIQCKVGAATKRVKQLSKIPLRETPSVHNPFLTLLVLPVIQIYRARTPTKPQAIILGLYPQ